MTTREELTAAEKYLHQLAPHQRDRQGGQVLEDLIALCKEQQTRIDALEASIKDHDAQCTHTCDSRAKYGTCAYRDQDGAYRYPNGRGCHDCPKEYIIRILENTAPLAPRDSLGEATQAEAVCSYPDCGCPADLAAGDLCLLGRLLPKSMIGPNQATHPHLSRYEEAEKLINRGFNEGIEAYAAKLKRIGFLDVDKITAQLKKGGA